MDMTSYFLGRNSSSGADFNIVEPATDETFEDTDIYNANGMNVVINGILEMIDGIMPTLSDLVAESISDCERTYNKTKYIDINSGENLYPNAKAVYNYGQQIAQSRQEILKSGENIKTINGQSILGKGDISISGGSSINVSGAAVGQTIKVSSVNENGVPTAWETADFPAGSDKWEHICDISVKQEDELTKITQDLGGSFKKLLIYINKNSNDGLVTATGDSYSLSIRDKTNRDIARMIHTNDSGWTIHTFIIEWIEEISKLLSCHSPNNNKTPSTYALDYSIPLTYLSFQTDGTKSDGTVCIFRTFTINIYGVRI